MNNENLIDVRTEGVLQDLEALLEAAARLIEAEETKLAVSLIYQGLDKIRSL